MSYNPAVHPEAGSQANFAHKSKKAPKSTVLSHSTHPKEMPHGNREADGEGRRAQVVLPALVGRSEDAQDQLEGEEELDGHRLPCRRLVVQLEREKKRVRGWRRLGTGLEMWRGKPRELDLADNPLLLFIFFKSNSCRQLQDEQPTGEKNIKIPIPSFKWFEL